MACGDNDRMVACGPVCNNVTKAIKMILDKINLYFSHRTCTISLFVFPKNIILSFSDKYNNIC